MAKFGARSVRQDAKLGNGIDGKLNHEAAIDGIEVVRAINQKIVGFRTLAIHGVGLAVTQRASSGLESGSQGKNPGLKQTQLRKITAVQGQIQNLAFTDGFTQAGHGGFQKRGVGMDADFFPCGSHFETNGNRRDLIYAE